MAEKHRDEGTVRQGSFTNVPVTELPAQKGHEVKIYKSEVNLEPENKERTNISSKAGKKQND